MPSPFTEADRAILRRPHVDKVWFADLDLPVGRRRMHSGTGRIVASGHEWRGITDPGGTQVVGIQQINEPRFGQASALTILVAGVNVAFLRSVRQDMAAIEGRPAVVYFAAYDQESGTLMPLRQLFPGQMSAPTIQWVRDFGRVITITIESRWHGQNFPFGGKWSSTGQRERWGNDSGGDFIGVKVKENYK